MVFGKSKTRHNFSAWTKNCVFAGSFNIGRGKTVGADFPWLEL